MIELTQRAGNWRLQVDGRPFLILGGELGNSTASSRAQLEACLDGLVRQHLNTVLLPAYWELLEPTENQFDFGLVDAALDAARARGLRLVLLWFGSWKNSMSCYAPAWVKRDAARVVRAELPDGTRVERLSAFCEENAAADARAFATLMAHLGEQDGSEQTVLMVQVENEVGMLEAAREWGRSACAAFAQPVPQLLCQHLQTDRDQVQPQLRTLWEQAGGRTSGSWAEVFGEGLAGQEVFQAWHYARYVERVARAGQRRYALPLFTNAALNAPNRQPGQYPSGGPLPHLIDLWKLGAPSLGFLAPDIYFPEFAYWSSAYARADNALFIPEAQRTADAAAHACYAVGRLGAIGFAPFGVDADSEGVGSLAETYALLQQAAPMVVEQPGRGRTSAVLLDRDHQREALQFGSLMLEFAHDFTCSWTAGNPDDSVWPRVGALVHQIDQEEFLVLGGGVVVTFVLHPPGRERAGILRIDEGHFEAGRWVPGRRLNGDESHQGRHLRIPCGQQSIQRVKLYRYS
jgi:beta-galactosidase GanA